MNVALVSLLALVAVIVVSCFTPVNIGVLAVALAFLIGHFLGGLPVKTIVAGFPAGLFLTLAGITLLFAQARVNGTLDTVAGHAVRLARGNTGLIPIVFFVLAAGLAAIGAGNIGATALLAPVAMGCAGRAGIPAFLMAMMLANGANAGGFSPLAPTGIIATDLMARAGMPGAGWANFLNTLAAQTVVAFAGYFLFGGVALLRRQRSADEGLCDPPLPPLLPRQRLTVAVIGALIVCALLGMDVGMGAFVGTAILALASAADEEQAIRSMPWGIILMVSGVTILVEVLGKTGGLELFTALLARLSNPTWVTGVIAFVTGVISVYSSSSGVVLPTFLPTIPGLVEKLGGGNPLMIAYSINVGAHMVDVSPLSTLGALCLAVAAPQEDRTALFRKLLAWGWSMAVVGAVVCQLMFGFR
jgi:Na+/H+ antiporter NhaD/arsenite permease-like protein